MAFNPTQCMKITAVDATNISIERKGTASSLTPIYFSKTGADDTWVTSISLAAGESAFAKGTGPTATSDSDYTKFVSTGRFKVSGNITSLLNDGEGGNIPITASYCFSSFLGSENLVGVSKDFLPSTTLSSYCYKTLFGGSNIETSEPIILPADNPLPDGCYQAMFMFANKISKIEVHFKRWNSDATSMWFLYGPDTPGEFYCYEALSDTHGSNYIPDSWTRVVIEDPPGPEPVPFPENILKFEALADNCTISLPASKVDSSSYYFSTDNVTWVPNTITVSQGQIVAVKGTNYPKGSIFSINKPVNISGSVMSLVDGVGEQLTISETYAFKQLFQNKTVSINISGNLLPATTLAVDCYYRMFYGCRGLTSLPENLLPATTLVNACYEYMFYNCTGLTSLPENLLPATTLADYCYQYMFYGCSKLATVPKNLLPATTLAAHCYYYMFYNCSVLTNAPDLPATTLTTDCYRCMFENCAALKTPPDLPATTLGNYCYANMFKKCSSLEYAPELPATTLTTHCYENMFESCSKVSNLPDLPAKVAKPNCYTQMFYGTAITEVARGKIALTTFDTGCCHGMFALCNKLTKLTLPPVSPQASDAYGYLCMNCPSLQEITYLGPDWGYTGSPTAFNNWVGGSVPSTGTFKCVSSLPETHDTHHIPVGWTVVISLPDTILKFEVLEDNCTISLPTSKVDASHYLFSKDTVNWVQDTITANKGDIVAVKGSNYPGGAKFSINKPVNISGSIMSLVDGIGEQTTILSNRSRAFQQLFEGITVSINIGGDLLPATSLSGYCYYYMFNGCTGLTTIPKGLLPATTLTNYCYSNMFQNCSNLISIPKNLLPATIAADHCYYNMFSGCSGLTALSENLLPATTLANYCYSTMFSGCSGLTTLPENLLPATTLAERCYDHMFYKCSGLTVLSQNLLPATTLQKYCYYYMFYGCSGLTTLPQNLLPATTLQLNCYGYMFSSCSGLTSLPANLLLATTLASNCCACMFNNCSGLTTLSEKLLPATTLADYCYSNMFSGCSGLTTLPEKLLPATTLQTYCYANMFARCDNLTTIPKSFLPAKTLATYCYSNMFQNCTKVNTMPDLPAKTAEDYCYNRMFTNTAITEVAKGKIALTTFKNSCCKEMFSSCANLSKLTIPVTTPNEPNVYQNMCYGCSSLKEITYLGSSWGQEEAPATFNNWVGGGVPATGTFYRNSSLPEIYDTSHIPPTWTIEEPPAPPALFNKKAEKKTKTKFVFLAMNDTTNRVKLITLSTISYRIPDEPPLPVQPGRTFKGWSMTPNGTILPAGSGIILGGHIYLYAQYDTTTV